MTAKVRVGWKKLKELSGVLCGKKWSVRPRRVFKARVRTAVVHDSET